tara:strand:- start:7178 stop:7423 length:246 start_codon:yes stop_codon:yes gene_type:complete
MKKDRTVLYGALALIGVYVFIQYQKNKEKESDSSSFSNAKGRRRKLERAGICGPPKVYCPRKQKCSLPIFCRDYDELPDYM